MITTAVPRPAPPSTGAVPSTMRAVVADRYGPPESVRIDERPVPTPGWGLVLVKVAAAGVDRGTWHLLTGLPRMIRLATGLRRPRQPIPGLDLAGTVVAVGPEVTDVVPGDEVFGEGTGAFAEYALLSAAKLAGRPESLPMEQTAILAVSGVAALQAVEAARVEPGQTVLVIGASGGVGSYAVQIAAAAGAVVTGVCSDAKGEFVRSLGAARVVDYTRQRWWDDGRRYDAIIDINGNAPLRRLRGSLERRGTLVVVGGEFGGPWTGGFGRSLRAALLSPFVSQRLVMLYSKVDRAGLDRLVALVNAGSVVPQLDVVLPVEQAAAAVARLAAGAVKGKLALQVSPRAGA